MRKMIVAVLVVLLLTAGTVFAKGFEIGAQLGYGLDRTVINTETPVEKSRFVQKAGGFSLSLTGEYNLSKEFGLKLEAGFQTMGVATYYLNGKKNAEDPNGATPMNWNFYIGGEYNLDFDSFKLGIGAGADMMYGLQTAIEEDKPNGRIGAALEVVGKYEVSKGITLTAGAKGAFYFINTGSSSESYVPLDFAYWENETKLEGGKASHFQYGLKFFAGCTYAF